MTADFAHAHLPVVDKPVLRMGLAGNYGATSDDVRWGAERGMNYWVWGASYGKVAAGIRDVIARDRDHHVVAMLGMAVAGWQVRRSVEGALRSLKTEYLDVFKLGWLGVTSRESDGIYDALLKLKAEGKLRAIGTSIHDRPRAGRLAEDSPVDLLMIRYNAKHPGAERDIFPHLAARNPGVVAYTALAWGQLVRPVKGIEMPPWPGGGATPPPLTPELCYRFALTNPHVHVVLTGPRDRAQLEENLRALEQGPLPPEELAWVRQYGAELHKKRKLDYVR
jgi:aryl-alcohol dehydrogenase-like predicted oxidoreductase